MLIPGGLTGFSLYFLAISALIFVPLEIVFPATRPARIQALDVAMLWFYPVFGVWIALGVLGIAAGYIQTILPHATLDFVRNQPIWTQCLAAIVSGEFWFYLMHRLFHQSKLLWKIHRLHHTITPLTWSAAFRVHPLDFMIILMGANLPAMIFGISLEPIVFFIAIERMHTILLHSNVTFGFGWVGKLIVSPQYHRQHHLHGQHNYNFASIFTIFDTLGGTRSLKQSP